MHSLSRSPRAALLGAAFTVVNLALTSAHAQGVMASLEVDSGANVWKSDFSSFFSIDPQTGKGVLPPVGTALNTTDSTAGWSWKTFTDDIPTGGSPTDKFATWRPGEVDANGQPPAQVAFFKATLDIDPSLFYSFSAKNNTTAVQSYTFTYGEAMVPAVSGGYSLTSDVAIALTRFSSLGAVGGFVQTLKLSNDGGATFVTAPGHNVGTSVSNPSNHTATFDSSSNLGFDAATSGTGNYNYWELITTFTLSGNGSSAGIVGEADIEPIPEPSVYALLVGAAAFALALRRRVGFAG